MIATHKTHMATPRYSLSLASIGLLLFAALPATAEVTPDERKEAILALEERTPSAEQLQRKQRSEDVLGREDVPILESLPVIGSRAEASIPTEHDVESRALCLLVVALKGEGVEQPIIDSLIADYELDAHLSPAERRIITGVDDSRQQHINAVWRYEAAWVMLWALGFVDELDRPDKIIDAADAVRIMSTRTVEEFRNDGVLRPAAEILDAADLIYRYHWAVVDARVNSESTPAGLEPGVVYERHYALNWLVGYMDQAWDDISTDT